MNNIFILTFVISFLGILVFILAAIISLIRKRPAKKRFKFAGISFIIAIVSFIGVGATMDKPVTPTYIQLSIPDYQNTYSTNAKIPINISVIPEDASTDTLEYIASGGTLAFSDNGVITGTEEGSFEIYIKSGNITSNTLTINVQNANAQEKAINNEHAEDKITTQEDSEKQASKKVEQKLTEETEIQRLAEEQASKEAEQKKLAEEQAAKEKEQERLAEEQAAREAEQKRLAEEQAAREAEQKQLQAQIAQESISRGSTGTSGNESNFNTYDNAAQQETNATYVLNTSTHKIHYPDCSSVPKIAPHNYATSNSSVSELTSQGYTTCGNCFK